MVLQSSKDHLFKHWRWRIFAVTWLTYASFYFTRKAFAVAKIGIIDDPNLGLTKETLANIDGVYLLSYAIGQFLWGILADKYGPRKVLLGGLFISGLASLTMGLIPSLLIFVSVSAVQGLAQSTGWSSCCKNMSNFFSRHERGKVMGWWCTNYAAGGLVASPFAGWWAYSVFGDWRYAFIAPAIYIFLIWLLVLLFQKNRPQDIGLPSIEEFHGEEIDVVNTADIEAEGTFEVVKSVLTNQTVMLLGLVYFLLKPTRYTVLFWGPFIVMEQVPGVSKLAAATAPISFEVAGILAPIIIGYISDRYFGSRRMPPSAISLGLCTIALFAFIPVSQSFGIWGVTAIFFLIGLTLYGPDSIVAGSAAVDFGTAKGAGTATGIVNGLGSVGAIFGGLLPGYIDSSTLFYIFAGINLLSMCILLAMWKRVPISVQRETS